VTGYIRVLVADDDPGTRDLLVSVFELAGGMEVVGLAPSARDAVLKALATKPDVCVLDVRMPGGGLEAAERLRTWCPGTAVVIFSVLADADTRLRAFEAGADSFVVKGRPVGEIVDAVRRAACRPRPVQRLSASISPVSSA
jgi:DNA-binding NarL/FixJ family response regulator